MEFEVGEICWVTPDGTGKTHLCEIANHRSTYAHHYAYASSVRSYHPSGLWQSHRSCFKKIPKDEPADAEFTADLLKLLKEKETV